MRCEHPKRTGHYRRPLTAPVCLRSAGAREKRSVAHRELLPLVCAGGRTRVASVGAAGVAVVVEASLCFAAILLSVSGLKPYCLAVAELGSSGLPDSVYPSPDAAMVRGRALPCRHSLMTYL